MIVAFDIGGSRIKSALVGEQQNIIEYAEAPTPLEDFDIFAQQIRQLVVHYNVPVKGVAISITGVVDRKTGKIKCANIPCIDGLEIQDKLEQFLDLPVWIANDADCFVLAEAISGAGRGHQNVFGIILGSGVGGSWVVDGKPVEGGGGYIGEWGHGSTYSAHSEFWSHPIPAFACSCGNRGCLNTIGGARGLEHLHHYLHKEELDSREIIDQWQGCKAASGSSVKIMADLMSNQLALVLNVTGATIVPVGGGLSNSPELIDFLDQLVRRKMLNQVENPVLVKGQVEGEAGLRGAAILGINQFT